MKNFTISLLVVWAVSACAPAVPDSAAGVGFDSYELSIKMEVVLLMLDVDGNGQIETTIYDDEDEDGENYRIELVSIYEALNIAREFYETGDLTGYLRSVAYDYFYILLEKYGLPIDVEVDIK
mgnify:CR=1 FL=1